MLVIDSEVITIYTIYVTIDWIIQWIVYGTLSARYEENCSLMGHWYRIKYMKK